MYSIIRWIEEYALADFGVVDENARADAVRMSDTQVCDFLERQQLVLPTDEAIKRYQALRDIGRNYKRMSGTEFVEAMTTAHFATYFGDALNRAFYADYAYVTSGWLDYTYQDVAPDFRDVDRLRMSEPGTLRKRREKQSMATTHVTETQIHYGVEEYAEQFDVSWRTLKDDDLGKIKETPARMVKAAKRWLDQWVSALYDNATTAAALGLLGATYFGTGRLTHANLAIGLNAMMQHVDANGNQMNIQRVWLVIPKVLEIQARTILQSTQASGTPNNDANVLPQFIAGYRVDPYIAFAGINVPWYLFADPAEIPTVTVCRLNGWPGPISFMKESNIRMLTGAAPAEFLMGSFETGDIEFAVEDVVGGWDDAAYVGVTDFRGIYMSNGTTA
jgi:hypothetical protein